MPFPILGIDLIGPVSADRAGLTVNRAIFDSLTVRDDATGDIKPGLALSWQNTDPLTWSFKLRPNVKFHDGTAFSSADVKATILAFIAKKGPLAPLVSDIGEIDTPDAQTVVLKIAHPLGMLTSSLSLIGIAPAAAVNNPNFAQHPVGTGPFIFDTFQPGAHLSLKANEFYWGGAPGVAKLTFEVIPETTARLTALETGDVDITWGVPADQVSRLAATPGLTVKKVQAYLNYEILLNWNRPPLNQLNVRKALVAAVDFKTIADTLLGGLAQPAQGPAPQTVFGAAKFPPYEHNPAKARDLLSGVPAADLGKLTILARQIEDERQVAQALISDWAKVGLTVKPDFEENAQWTQNYIAEKFDMAIVIRPTLTGDADYTFGRLYLSTSKRVPCANADLDKQLIAGASGTDPQARKVAYQQAFTFLWDQVCGIYPLDVLDAAAWRNQVQGFNPPPSTIPSFVNVRLATK